VIRGRVQSSAGTPLPGVEVQLSGPMERSTKADASAFYEFSGLLPGTYTLRTGKVSQAVTVDGLQPARLDLVVPVDQIEKLLTLALLMGSTVGMGTRVNLRLARPYVRAFAPVVTFRAEEAEQARQVLIVGDVQAVSDTVEDRLRAAGCQVARIGGTPYAVEDAFARLVAAGTPLPKGRSAVVLPRRRPGER